jgi:hypothetical protein
MTDDRDAQRAARRAETEAMVEAEAAKAKEVLTKRAEQRKPSGPQKQSGLHTPQIAPGAAPMRNSTHTVLGQSRTERDDRQLALEMESRARKSRALNSSLLGTRYTVGTLDNVGAVAYLGGGAHV